MFLFSQILVEINEKREKKIKEDNKNINTLKNNKFNIKIINKENSIEYIDMDIDRTFSYLGLFKIGSPLAEDLREILRAFVASRPDIGYVL